MRPSPILALSLVVLFPAAGATPIATVEESVFIGDLPASPDASCSGNSPVMPICTTGVYTSDFSFGFGFSWSGNYRGTLENRLDYLGNAFVFKCVINGAAFQCSLSGKIPNPGTLVLHDCRSLDSTTGALGGTGSWRCSFFP